MGQIYYDKNGCSISDTVFVTPIGDQYLIRNISSVKVRQNDYWWILALGIIFICLAIKGVAYMGIITDNVIGVFLLGIVTIIIWWFKRVFILWISSGGVYQEALTFQKAKSGGLQNIQQIYDALNLAIANLQK